MSIIINTEYFKIKNINNNIEQKYLMLIHFNCNNQSYYMSSDKYSGYFMMNYEIDPKFLPSTSEIFELKNLLKKNYLFTKKIKINENDTIFLENNLEFKVRINSQILIMSKIVITEMLDFFNEVTSHKESVISFNF